jgi:hypothetical protein
MGQLMKNIDRNTFIGVVITSIIALFYSYIIFGVYLFAVVILYLIGYTWNVFDLTKLNSVFRNITLSVVTIFVMTILCEIWLQLYPHKFTGIDGVNVVGEFSDFTSRGYLTEDVLKNKKEGVRILGLGDSFSIILREKKQNYNDILQQKFNARGKRNVEIVNAGMEAMGPGYYWHVLNKFGDLFKPDLVLVGFFIGNDFEQADFSVYIGNYIIEPKDLWKRYSKYDQFSHWRLYRLLKNKYTRYRDAQMKKEEVKTQPAQQVGTFSQATFLEVEKERSWIFHKDKRKLLNRYWRECSEIILKMKDWCDRRQIPFVIAILPEQFQVDQKLRQAVFAKYHQIAAENLDLTYPDKLIVNFCRTHGIHCLDMLAQFQEEGKTRQLYILRDSHLNAAGNRLAADLIFAYLERNQLVTPRPRQ